MFSLAIQEKIQNIINKKTLLLAKANNEAYLENTVLYTFGGVPTLYYNSKKNVLLFTVDTINEDGSFFESEKRQWKIEDPYENTFIDIKYYKQII